jgi:hypothetical protein
MAKRHIVKISRKNHNQAPRNPREWFAAIDRAKDDRLLRDGRKQPRAPRRQIFS